ncbi:MAG TPA: sporulation protein YqfC, partial [Firmicutes bacterium]|nr:sporulation protein YqfC [Bacillota bacterium]
GLPRLTLVGNLQLLVENHRGVIAYSDQVIRIGVSNGELVVKGRELQIKNLYAEELMIKGVIEGLEYEI